MVAAFLRLWPRNPTLATSPPAELDDGVAKLKLETRHCSNERRNADDRPICGLEASGR
jgi:hypothetical protein